MILMQQNKTYWKHVNMLMTMTFAQTSSSAEAHLIKNIHSLEENRFYYYNVRVEEFYNDKYVLK